MIIQYSHATEFLWPTQSEQRRQCSNRLVNYQKYLEIVPGCLMLDVINYLRIVRRVLIENTLFWGGRAGKFLATLVGNGFRGRPHVQRISVDCQEKFDCR